MAELGARGAFQHVRVLPVHEGAVRTMSGNTVSGNCKILTATGREPSFCITTLDREEVESCDTGFIVSAVCWKGERAVVAGENRIAEYDLDPVRASTSVKLDHDGVVECLVVVGEEVASGWRDGAVLVGDRLIGEHSGAVHALAVGGAALWSGSADRTVRAWSVSPPSQLLELRGHGLGVMGVLVGMETVYSVGMDRTIRVWGLDGEEQRVERIGSALRAIVKVDGVIWAGGSGREVVSVGHGRQRVRGSVFSGCEVDGKVVWGLEDGGVWVGECVREGGGEGGGEEEEGVERAVVVGEWERKAKELEERVGELEKEVVEKERRILYLERREKELEERVEVAEQRANTLLSL